MRLLPGLIWLLFAAAASAAVQRAEINFDRIRNLAVARAGAPYRAADPAIPARLATLTYDEFRLIQFRADRALWHPDRLPFEVRFFPRGGLFHDSVQLHEFSSTHVQDIPFDPGLFRVGEIKDLPALPAATGFAGFKILYPLNQPGVQDEVIAFLGASYFRALGAGQRYGLSARGLALDSALAGRKEEFPRFVEWWLGKPAGDARAVTLYGLMDSPSVAGAYEFVVTPGKATTVDVRAALIFRSVDAMPGIAPLTSMFWFGENSERPAGELRPEVHDSDGLLVESAPGGAVWHALHNPRTLENKEFPASGLVRFGLLQRDRNVRNYEDLEAQYERRPSAWIEPQGDWGKGAVHLAQLPATREYGDNIVTYWVPETRPTPRQPFELRYRLVWASNDPPEKVARVVGTREGMRPNNAAGRMFWVDFADAHFRDRTAAQLKPEVEVGPGARLIHSAVSAYSEISGWRVAIEIEPQELGHPVELRCRVRDNSGTITETWSYTWIR